jgi:hypothetical protein
MPQAWIDPEVDLRAHMEQIKYPKARIFLGYLRDANLRALQIDSLGWDGVKEAYTYFNDVDVLVRREDQAALIALLREKGYQMVRDDAVASEESAVDPQELARYEHAVGGSVYSWTDIVKWPADLWISYQNTWQHWNLMLVDLTPWFEAGVAETITVMDDTQVELPPAWGRMLWLIDRAMELAEEHDCEKLSAKLASIKSLSSWPTFSWESFLPHLQRCETESQARHLRYLQFTGELGNPTSFASRPLPNEKGRILSASYHVLRAIEDLYPDTVPASVLTSIEPGACPRLLGLQQGDPAQFRYRETSIRVECCLPEFGIAQQLQDYGHLTGQELIDEGVVEVYAHCDYGMNPPQSRITEEQLQAIFAPL